MARNAHQYTIRNVPSEVDAVLRRRARTAGKSINQVALDVLTEGAGALRVYGDLDFMVGSMRDAEGDRLDREIANQRRIDPKLWK